MLLGKKKEEERGKKDLLEIKTMIAKIFVCERTER